MTALTLIRAVIGGAQDPVDDMASPKSTVHNVCVGTARFENINILMNVFFNAIFELTMSTCAGPTEKIVNIIAFDDESSNSNQIAAAAKAPQKGAPC